MKKNDFLGIEDIAETIREPLLVLDANLNILSANRSFYRIFKVEQGETIGYLIFDVGNKQWDIPALRTLLEDILPKHKRFDNYEVEHDFPAIGHKTMLLNARQIYRKDVDTQKILLAIEDITERKKVEKALEANEAKYRELVQNANSIILRMDPKGKVTFFNEFAQRFFGYSEEAMLGCSVVGTIVPETESSGRDLDFMINDIGIHPEKYINNEHENVRRNGERVWVAWTNKAIRDGNGNVIETLCIGNDITKHKQLESLLEESEERYRRLFETANDGILLLEKHEGKITHANPAATEMLGYSKEEYIGKKLQDIGVSLDTGDIQKIMQTLDKSGIIYYDDVPVKTKSGQYIDTDIYMVDRARLVQCNIRDITEHKKDEDELRLFKNLINQANDAILVIDPVTGRFLDVNAKACNNLGYDREELLKMGVLDIDDIVMPDTLSWKAHVDNIKNEGHLFLEGRHRRKDGTTYPVEVNVQYISFEKSDYMVAVARDISERKKADEALQKSEKKYKDLFDSTLDGIYRMDADGVFILMNPAGAKMFGYESPDEIIGRKALEYWRDPRDRDVFREELKIKKSVSDYRMKLKKKDGEPIELETSSTIKEDKKGALLGMEGIVRDVTERQKLKDQLLQAQKMEAVGQLAGGISHDFNNILTAMIGYGHLIKMKLKEDDPLKTYAEQILLLSDKAANLTKSLLAFSRKQIINPRPVDLNEVIKRIDHLLSRIIGEDIKLQALLSEKALIVMADPGQIEQVLMNLATNARDAMLEGGFLTIGMEKIAIDEEFIKEHGFGKEGAYALIAVTDTGAGMDRETREKIFEPFFTTKEVGKGTGLGLSMVYGIIKQHDGYINVYSEPGSGTTFRIYLPLIQGKADEIKPEVIQTIERGTEIVLLAEDQTEVREFTKKLLEEYGYKVITAGSGQEAIDEFKAHKDEIQLLLLDVIMPNKNGREAYEEIKKIRPDIKVLFMSGYPADIIHKHDIIEKGFAYIEKPASPTKLLRKIREALDK
jgi:two-component system, cell cycle sensor histidine kinase and response regulator CckA